MVEVEHVKAHRTKKGKLSQFEKFIAEGTEKADVLAKSRSSAT